MRFIHDTINRLANIGFATLVMVPLITPGQFIQNINWPLLPSFRFDGNGLLESGNKGLEAQSDDPAPTTATATNEEIATTTSTSTPPVSNSIDEASGEPPLVLETEPTPSIIIERPIGSAETTTIITNTNPASATGLRVAAIQALPPTSVYDYYADSKLSPEVTTFLTSLGIMLGSAGALLILNPFAYLEDPLRRRPKNRTEFIKS